MSNTTPATSPNDLLRLLPRQATEEQLARAVTPFALALHGLMLAKCDETLRAYLRDEQYCYAAADGAAHHVLTQLAAYLRDGTVPGWLPFATKDEDPLHVACNEARRLAREEMLALVAQHGLVASELSS